MLETFLLKLSELFGLTGLGGFRIVLSSSSTPQQFHYSCVTVVEARDVPGPTALVLFPPHSNLFWRWMCLLHSRVMTYREHGAWVVKAHLQKETDGHIISVRYPPPHSLHSKLYLSARSPVLTVTPPSSVNGDVRFFEPRAPDSINVLQTVKGLTALDIHPQANLFAWWDPTLTSFHTVSPTLLHFSK